MQYPGMFAGVLESISEMLISLGKEWAEYGKEDWATKLIDCGEQTLSIAKSLSKLKEEFESEKNATTNLQNIKKS